MLQIETLGSVKNLYSHKAVLLIEIQANILVHIFALDAMLAGYELNI
jgi:hypothetical protein